MQSGPINPAAGAQRVPPHSLEAERSVLGAMMQDADALRKAIELLRADDFYHPAHKELFGAMLAVHNARQPVDLVTLDAELTRRGTLDGVGGAGYLIEISQYVPTTANVLAYVQIVEEKSTLRKLLAASGEIAQDCYAQHKQLPALLNDAERAIFDITLRRGEAGTLIHVGELVGETFQRMHRLVELKGQIDGVPSGFHDVDDLLTGLHPGELVLVGARPSMGKTSFAMNMVQNAGIRHNKTVAAFSLEMPREQLMMRMLCSEARVDMQAVRRGSIRFEEWEKLAKAMSPVAAAPIYLDDTSGITPTQVRSRCRRLMMERGLDMIMIDYLQLMGSDGRSENRQQEVSELTRALKGIAQELRVPLVACAQLSRAAVQRADKRPMLSDLRDSGSIEQDADVVMFLHRE
ncbi:MAG: replicative DNA helicase, partial [Clostridia bacterium]|nr:replicative DNA helicase [Clostridia bacterium]